MPVRSNAKEFVNLMKNIAKQAKAKTKENVKFACYEMVAEAKRCTPPHEGEERGRNTVTGNMARHWDSSYTIENNDSIKVRLFNNVQYASYVENGHRMKEHFVPWLYINGTGTIARHQPLPGEPLFGLFVGTKTKYVQPEHIVEKAKKRFFEAYYALQTRNINQINDKLEQLGN